MSTSLLEESTTGPYHEVGEPVICHNIIWKIGGTEIDVEQINIFCFVVGNLS